MPLTTRDLNRLRSMGLLDDPRKALEYRKQVQELGGEPEGWDAAIEELVSYSLPRNRQEDYRLNYKRLILGEEIKTPEAKAVAKAAVGQLAKEAERKIPKPEPKPQEPETEMLLGPLIQTSEYTQVKKKYSPEVFKQIQDLAEQERQGKYPTYTTAKAPPPTLEVYRGPQARPPTLEVGDVKVEQQKELTEGRKRLEALLADMGVSIEDYQTIRGQQQLGETVGEAIDLTAQAALLGYMGYQAYQGIVGTIKYQQFLNQLKNEDFTKAVRGSGLERDPFEVLGVNRKASDEEILNAYKNLARQYHPDANPQNREAARQKFQEIAAAKNLLIGFGNQRARFNFSAAGAPKGAPAGPEPGAAAAEGEAGLPAVRTPQPPTGGARPVTTIPPVTPRVAPKTQPEVTLPPARKIFPKERLPEGEGGVPPFEHLKVPTQVPELTEQLQKDVLVEIYNKQGVPGFDLWGKIGKQGVQAMVKRGLIYYDKTSGKYFLAANGEDLAPRFAEEAAKRKQLTIEGEPTEAPTKMKREVPREIFAGKQPKEPTKTPLFEQKAAPKPSAEERARTVLEQARARIKEQPKVAPSPTPIAEKEPPVVEVKPELAPFKGKLLSSPEKIPKKALVKRVEFLKKRIGDDVPGKINSAVDQYIAEQGERVTDEVLWLLRDRAMYSAGELAINKSSKGGLTIPEEHLYQAARQVAEREYKKLVEPMLAQRKAATERRTAQVGQKYGPVAQFVVEQGGVIPMGGLEEEFLSIPPILRQPPYNRLTWNDLQKRPDKFAVKGRTAYPEEIAEAAYQAGLISEPLYDVLLDALGREVTRAAGKVQGAPMEEPPEERTTRMPQTVDVLDPFESNLNVTATIPPELAGKFDLDVEAKIIKTAITTMRQAFEDPANQDWLRSEGFTDEVRANVMNANPRIHLQMTGNPENAGRGQFAKGQIVVSWLPYSLKAARPAQMSRDNVAVLIHEFGHAAGADEVFDQSTAAIAVKVHEGAGNQLNPEAVNSQVNFFKDRAANAPTEVERMRATSNLQYLGSTGNAKVDVWDQYQNYEFVHSCPDSDEQSILNLTKNPISMTYDEFIDKTGKKQLSKVFPLYIWNPKEKPAGPGNLLKTDPAVGGFFKSYYRGVPAIYVVQSGTEYIFVPRKFLKQARVQPGTPEESLARRAATEEAARLEAQGQATMFGGTEVKSGGPVVPSQPETRVQGAGTPAATTKAKAEELAGQRNLLGGEAEAKGGKLFQFNVRGTPEWKAQGPDGKPGQREYSLPSGGVKAVPVNNTYSDLNSLIDQLTLWHQDTGHSTLFVAADLQSAGKFNTVLGNDAANEQFFIPAAEKAAELFGEFVFMPQGDELYIIQPGGMSAEEFWDKLAEYHDFLRGMQARGIHSGLTAGIANSRSGAQTILDKLKKGKLRGVRQVKPDTYSHLDTGEKLSTILSKGGTYAYAGRTQGTKAGRIGIEPEAGGEVETVGVGRSGVLQADREVPEAGDTGLLRPDTAGYRRGYSEARGESGRTGLTPLTQSASTEDINRWLESQPADVNARFVETVDAAIARGEDIIDAFTDAYNVVTQATAKPLTIPPEQAWKVINNLSTDDYRSFATLYNEYFDRGLTPEECQRMALEQVAGVNIAGPAERIPPRFQRQPLRERIEALATTPVEAGGENVVYGINRAARLFEGLTNKKIYEASDEELASFESQLLADIGRWAEFQQKFDQLKQLADTPYGEETYGLSRLYRAMRTLTGKTVPELTTEDLDKGLEQLTRSIPIIGAIAGKAERIGIQKGDAELILGRRRAFEWLKAEHEEYDDAALMPVAFLEDFLENMGPSIIPEFGYGWQAELWYEAKKQFETGTENPAVMTFCEEKSVFPDLPPDLEMTMPADERAKAYAQAVFDYLREVAVRPFKPYERSTELAVPAELEAAQKADLAKAKGGILLFPAGEVFDRLGLGDVFYEGVLAKNDYFVLRNEGSKRLKRAWKTFRNAVGKKAANQFSEKGELHAILDGKAPVEGYGAPYQKYVQELRNLENWLLEKVNSARATQGLDPLQLVSHYVLHTFNPFIQGMLDAKWVIPSDIQALYGEKWFKTPERMRPGFEKHRTGRETGLIKNMKLVLPRMLEAKVRYAALQPFLSKVRPIIDKIGWNVSLEEIMANQGFVPTVQYPASRKGGILARRYVEDWLKYQVMGQETDIDQYGKLMGKVFEPIGRWIGSVALKYGGERGQIAAAGWMKDPVGKFTKLLAKLNYAAALPLNFRLYTYDVVMSFQNLLNGPEGFLKGMEASTNPWAWKISKEFIIPGRIPAEFIQHELTKSPLDWATEIGMKPDALIDIWRTHCSAAGALYQVIKDENPEFWAEIKARAQAKGYDFYHAAYEVMSEKPTVYRPIFKRVLHRVATQQYIYDEINQPKIVQYPLGKPFMIFKTWLFNNLFRTIPEVFRLAFPHFDREVFRLAFKSPGQAWNRMWTTYDGQGFKVTASRRAGALMWLLGMIAMTVGLREVGVDFAQAWTPGGWQSKPAGPLLSMVAALLNALSTTMTDPDRSKAAWLEFKRSLPIFMLYSVAYTRLGKFVTGREPRWWTLFIQPVRYAPKDTWLGSFEHLSAQDEQNFVNDLNPKEVETLNRLLADLEMGKEVNWGRKERVEAARLGLKFVDYAKRLKKEKAKDEKEIGNLLKQGKIAEASQILYAMGYVGKNNYNKLQGLAKVYLNKRQQQELIRKIEQEQFTVEPSPTPVTPVTPTAPGQMSSTDYERLVQYVDDEAAMEGALQKIRGFGGDEERFKQLVEEARNYQNAQQGGSP